MLGSGGAEQLLYVTGSGGAGAGSGDWAAKVSEMTDGREESSEKENSLLSGISMNTSKRSSSSSSANGKGIMKLQ